MASLFSCPWLDPEPQKMVWKHMARLFSCPWLDPEPRKWKLMACQFFSLVTSPWSQENWVRLQVSRIAALYISGMQLPLWFFKGNFLQFFGSSYQKFLALDFLDKQHWSFIFSSFLHWSVKLTPTSVGTFDLIVGFFILLFFIF